MKDFEKFLRNSQRLEEFQTARKAKEVGEIQKFEKETARHQCQKLEQILEFARAVNEWQKQQYDEPEIDEQQWEQQRVQKKYEKPEVDEEDWEEEKVHKLQEIDGFDQQMQNIYTRAADKEFDMIAELQQDEYINAADNKFDVIAELQQDGYINAADNKFDAIAEIQGLTNQDNQTPELKQLPPAPHDAFVHDLTPLTETGFQRELKHNEETLLESQGPPQRLELRAPSPKAQSEIPGETEEEAEVPEKSEAVEEKPETGNVFFFRSGPDSKK